MRGKLLGCGFYLCACVLPIRAFHLPSTLIASVPKRHIEERTQRLYTSALVKSSASNTVFLTSFPPFLSLFSNRYGAMIIVTGFVGKQLVWYVAQSNIKEIHEKQHKEGKTPL